MSRKFYIAFHKSCGQMHIRDVFSLRPYPKVFVSFFLFFLKLIFSFLTLKFFFQFLMIRISVEGTWIFLKQGCWLVHGKNWTSGLKIKWFAPFRLGSFRRRELSFERSAIFFNSIYSVQLIWKYIVAGPSPATSNFIVLCLFTRFMSIPVVCVNGNHTWILVIFAFCKRRLRQCKFGVVVIGYIPLGNDIFFFFRILTCQERPSLLSWS